MRSRSTRDPAAQIELTKVTLTQSEQLGIQQLLEIQGLPWTFILEKYPSYALWIRRNFTRQAGKHFPDSLEPDYSAKPGILASIITMYKHFGSLDFIRLDLSKQFSDSSELSSIYKKGRALGQSLVGDAPGLILCHRSSAPTGSGAYHIHTLRPSLQSVPWWLEQAVKVGRAHVSPARQPDRSDLGEMVKAFQGLARYSIEPVDPRARTQRRFTPECIRRDVTPDLLAKLEATELHLNRSLSERSRTGKNIAPSRCWLSTSGQKFQSLRSDLAKELEVLTPALT